LWLRDYSSYGTDCERPLEVAARMSGDPELLDWIREAVVEAESWEGIRASLQAHEPPDGEDVRLRPFVFAFSYRLHERFTSTRKRAGGPFGSMVAGEGWRFPPALADIEEADIAAWQAALAAIDHPAVQARGGDPLWGGRGVFFRPPWPPPPPSPIRTSPPRPPPMGC
jgi:hypothetical protein